MKEINHWKYPILGAGIGLLLAVLLLTLGFLKTLLVLFLMILGAVVGSLVQRSGILEYILRK
ncbi:DUF2273 domain-containing protein [Streptococcus parasuis]|uniref:DUF2273 domain-containing protein n=1 Tax=Streptococcus parasuis TaxID=1501662 RepID=A0A4Q8L2V6_9STRE|nr:DUF2273 domain-containing protein [Streptococcus parasuis]HEM3456625.1 DUF2273 domain-containing protein [Streptococcus suis]MBV1943308.1 DUF2273 domain-containing protein [Streptococcus parasuis]QXF05033.1 DUF2273 domain-containing protein [Streptococcus parasuis]TAA13639.1 DUF2273 domain-containing protein [Streptococcus parasuis]HEP1570943.1 DUF2273 domain-containing protein [Streptococcus suis]